MSCAAPLALEALAAWWLAELPEAEAARLEEHLFGCAHCARRAEWVAALASGVRAALRSGAVGLAVTAQFVEAMKHAGLRLREYRLAPGGSVNCTVRADDDAVVGRVRASLAGVRRVDVIHSVSTGGVAQPEVRLEDVPFDPASGEVLLIPPAAWLKTLPAHTQRSRLVAVEESGERTLGEYTFVHAPS